MSKGKWTKETMVRQRKMIETLREKAAMQRHDTNERVMEFLGRDGPLSAEQLVLKTGLAKSTIQNAIDRLRRGGLVLKLNDRRRVGRAGIPAHLYGLGCDEDREEMPAPVVVEIRRHPQDVALFGEYGRASA